MARTIDAGALTRAQSRGDARTSLIHTVRGRRQRARERILRSAVGGAVGDAAFGRGWRGVEALETRTLLAVPAPIVHFDFETDAIAIDNKGTGGDTYDGTYFGTGGPNFGTRNNTFGDTTNTRALILQTGTDPLGQPVNTDQVIETPMDNATVFGLQPVLGKTASVAVWIKTTQVGTVNAWTSPGITGIEDGGADNDVFWGFIDNTGRIGVQAGNGAAAKSVAPVNDGRWHFIAMTRNMTSGRVEMWVDGSLDSAVDSATGERGNPTIGTTLTPGQWFKTVGAIEDDAGVASRDEFAGELDEFRAWDFVLTGAQIQELLGVTAPPTGAVTGAAAAADPTSPAQMNITWVDGVSNETRFEILRSTTPGGPYVTAGFVPVDSTSFVDAGLDPATTYHYVVRGVNSAGTTANSNEASATTSPLSVVLNPTANGVVGEYFNSLVPTNNEPNFNPATSVRRTIKNLPLLDVNWLAGPPDPVVQADNFSTRFSGTIKANAAGVYTFVSNTDDAGYLYVKGVLVSQDPGGHGQRDAAPGLRVPITLAAGEEVPFNFLQAEGGGDAGIHLKWIEPGGSLVVVPTTNLFTKVDLPTAAANLSATATPTSVNLSWTHKSLNENEVLVQYRRADTDPAPGNQPGPWVTVSRQDIVENPNSADLGMSFSVSGLAGATSYDFQVIDRNVAGEVAGSLTFTTQPVPPGSLSSTQAASAGDTNLTTEGNLDWVHWGLGDNPDAVNARSPIGIAPVIRQVNPDTIIWEAEETSSITEGDNDGLGWRVIDTTTTPAVPAGTSGDRALYGDEDAGGRGTDESRANYNIYFSEPGYYRLFARAMTFDKDGGGTGNNDSMFIPPSAGDIGAAPTFNGLSTGNAAPTWITRNDTGRPHHYRISAPGYYTFSIAIREGGFIVDRLALTRYNGAGLDVAGVGYNGFFNPQPSNPNVASVRGTQGPITDFTVIGSGTPTAADLGKTFSWSSGSPTETGATTADAVAVTGAGNGFNFTVPAGVGANRKLNVYVGVADGASGTLTATLSDGSAIATTQTLTSGLGEGAKTAVISIDFASGLPDQSLQVQWVSNGGQIVLGGASFVETSAPTAPTVTATGTGHGKIGIQWSEVANATSYLVQKAPDVGGAAGTFADFATVNAGILGVSDTVDPNTRFHYRVQAINALGSSSFSASDDAVSGNIALRGVIATFTDNSAGLATRYDNGTGSGARGRGPIDYNWGNNAPVASGITADNFQSRFDGRIIPDFTELYTFFAETDDQAAIYIDLNQNGSFETNERIMLDGTGHGMGNLRGQNEIWYGHPDWRGGVPLVAGQQYNFRFTQAEGGGGAGAALWWASPSQITQVVPLSNTAPTTQGPTPVGATTLTADTTLLNRGLLRWTYAGADSASLLAWTIERAPDVGGAPGTFAPLNNVDGTAQGYVDGTAVAGTRYWYRVFPINLGGVGAASNNDDATMSTNAVGNGARAHYFDTPTLAAGDPPDARTPILGPVWPTSTIDPLINHNWGAGAPPGAGAGFDANNFITRWTFKVKPEFTEAYTFYADTDDGYRLFLDGKLIPEGDHMEVRRGLGTRSPIGPFQLEAGKEYTVVFDMVEEGGDAGARLFWSSPTLTQELVPTAAMTALPAELDLTPPTIIGLHLDRPLPAGVPYTSKSRIHIQFSEDVSQSFSADTLTFFNQTTGEFLTADGQLDYIGWDPATNSAIVTFPGDQDGDGVITDGNWTIQVLSTIAVGNPGAPGIHDVFGNFLDGNGDGSGGDFFEGAFYKYNGDLQVDFNGNPLPDRKVDFIDYQVLQKNFGKVNPAPSEGDLDYDGDVDFNDFSILRARFGSQAPAAPVPAVAPAPDPVPVTSVTPVRSKTPPRKTAPKPAIAARPAPPSAAVARAPQTRFATKRIAGIKDVLAT